MSRYIDADALEYDTEWSEYHDGFTAYSQMAIDTAPSIDIVRCKECKYREKNHYCVKWGQPYLCNDECFCSYGERAEGINAPNKSEPKRGEWIYTSNGYGYIGYPVEKCSVCGAEYEEAPFNFCPNCGADMRGNNDE